MRIGNIEIEGKAALAPMAGVTDRAYREICAGFGAAYTVTEMVSAKALTFHDKKTASLMELGIECPSGADCPVGIQLFGSEPDAMAYAAQAAMKYGPAFIDINMGCPAPKITNSGSGSALMKDPELCGALVAAAVKAVPVPVAVKIRKGWDAQSINAVEVALSCEAAGAAAIAVHGRTRAEMYSPPADWQVIRQVKLAVRVPVIGNGDVDCAQSAARMIEETGCDLVMVGRGALGCPWVFRQINSYLTDEHLPPEPGVYERMTAMAKHITLMCEYKGEARAMNEARKHVGWYLKGLRGAAAFRKRAGTLVSLADMEALICDILQENLN